MNYADLGGMILFLLALAVITILITINLIKGLVRMRWRDVGELLIALVLTIALMLAVGVVLYAVCYAVGWVAVLLGA